MELYNKLSAREREVLIEKEKSNRLTISFYKYYPILNPRLFRDYFFIHLKDLEVLGRIYIAHEGINAQVSVLTEYMESFKAFLDSIDFLKNVRLNVAVEQDNKSFFKLKVKLRDKIVADGLDDHTFDVTKKGRHLNAQEFNALLANPDTICVDMRNHYESEIGHFKGAITPDVDTFRDSLPIIETKLKAHKENKNVLMYCTGGIRCEKASAYYKHKGFKNVFQLEGGIIEYVRQIQQHGGENKFIGKNFVFDHRRAERISEDIIAQCHQCGAPCDTHVNCANKACHLLFIQCEKCREKMHECCSAACKAFIALPAAEQKQLRKGKRNSHKIFKKGRSKVLKYKK